MKAAALFLPKKLPINDGRETSTDTGNAAIAALVSKLGASTLVYSKPK